MNDGKSPYGLLSETSGIEETRDERIQLNLPYLEGMQWLKLGWKDFCVVPSASIAYGLGMFVISIMFTFALVGFGYDYILFPALSGFMIIAPVFAIGLYEKSRAIEEGRRPSIYSMLLTRPAAGSQISFTGLLLCLLMLLWMRAAVLIYALFFGVRPFPGLEGVTAQIFGTAYGWLMLTVGTIIGGMFAAFAFSVSILSLPMLLQYRVDAMTAMALSVKLVWNNLTPVVVWGGVVLILFAASVATGFLGLIVAFPVLGHATWHAYRAFREPVREALED